MEEYVSSSVFFEEETTGADHLPGRMHIKLPGFSQPNNEQLPFYASWKLKNQDV